MPIPHTEMALRSWNRFVIEGLVVCPEVMGLQHVFQFGSAEIEIKLPASTDADREDNYDQIAAVTSWWAADNSPIQYEIYKVDVAVRMNRTVNLPTEVLKVNANAFELIPEEQQNTLENISEAHGQVAENAVRHWLSILRWITDDYRITRPYFASSGGDWGVRLFDETTQKKIWIQSSTAYAKGHHRVSLIEWKAAEAQLKKGSEPPIHISLKHDAEKFLAVGDQRRAIIDLAVSCETFLRHAICSMLPSQLSESMRNFIQEANIKRYIDKFLPSALTDDAAERYKTEIKPALTRLFEKRNDIMHQAINIPATTDNCNDFLQALNKLLALVSSELKEQSANDLT